MLQIILLETKDFITKNTKIFLLSAFAFLLSCIAINIALTNFVMAIQEQNAMKDNYGNKCYFKVNLGGDEEVFSNFFGNGKNAEKIKNAFEQLNKEKSFDYRYVTENGIDFFNTADSTYGKKNFPTYPKECVFGYESGKPVEYDDYLQLKGILADRQFQTEPNITLSEGKWFDEKDFCVESLKDIHLPVILGNEYKRYYQIGDTLTHAHIATEDDITLKVIGFFEKDSYFYDNNNTKILLNRYIVVPSVETNCTPANSFFKQSYDATKIMNARVICTEEDQKNVTKKVNQIFAQNQLYELRLENETNSAKKSLEEAKSLAWSSFLICIVILLFSIIMYGIQMYYKLLQNRRKYSIFQLNGIVRKQIFLLTLTDTLSVFILTDFVFVILWALNAGRGLNGLGLTGWTFVVIPVMEFFILIIMGILGIKRMKRLDMSRVLRENE